MSVFFSGFMRNESERRTNKSREPRSGSRMICLFRAPIHSQWTQKKRHSFVSNKDLSLNSPINVINSKFPQQRVLNIILCINHCACDLPNCQCYIADLPLIADLPPEDLQWCWKTIADLPPLQSFPLYHFNRYRFYLCIFILFVVSLWKNWIHNWL